MVQLELTLVAPEMIVRCFELKNEKSAAELRTGIEPHARFLTLCQPKPEQIHVWRHGAVHLRADIEFKGLFRKLHPLDPRSCSTRWRPCITNISLWLGPWVTCQPWLVSQSKAAWSMSASVIVVTPLTHFVLVESVSALSLFPVSKK